MARSLSSHKADAQHLIKDDAHKVVGDVQLVVVRPGSDLLRRVKELGDDNRRWTGLLTPAAWDDYAQKGTITAAIGLAETEDAAELLGYVAYRLPRNEVVIAHLVVSKEVRGRGLAKLLVKSLSERYADRRGVVAACRRDWPAHGMWPRLGFIALGDRRGRSSEGHLLTSWWLDHGHDDLMTWQGAPSRVQPVVLDSNVFLDLHSTDDVRSRESEEILLEVLEGRVELLVTPEIHNEIDRSAAAKNRARLHAVADRYPRLAVAPAQVEAMVDQIKALLGKEQKRNQTISDIRHVAYAACAGVSVVVTRDDPAIRKLRTPALEAAGVRLVAPQELVLLVDEFENVPAYWPAALLGTGYQVAEVAVDEGDEIRRSFLDTAGGERRRDFDTEVRELARRRPASHLLVYRDPSNSPVALVGCYPDEKMLTVNVLRVRPSPLAVSLAAQIVNSLRRLAHESDVEVMLVRDRRRSELVHSAAIMDGFRGTSVGLVGVTMPRVTTTHQLPATLDEVLKRADTDVRDTLAGLRDRIDALAQGARNAGAAAGLEHQLRPLRLLDADIPTWLVPIKPAWSSQLFGVPQQLLSRPDHLGISVEHVYYRSARSAGEQVPGRVLWYVSSPESAIVACSAILEVAQGSADQMWRRFRRLGVYSKADVEKTAGKSGNVRALRVTDTEVFPTSLPLHRLNQIADRLRQTLRLVSATRISTDLFIAVTREVRHDH